MTKSRKSHISRGGVQDHSSGRVSVWGRLSSAFKVVLWAVRGSVLTGESTEVGKEKLPASGLFVRVLNSCEAITSTRLQVSI